MLVGRDPTELEALLRENLGFDDDTLPRPLSSLSSSWRMKFALARCGGKVLLHNYALMSTLLRVPSSAGMAREGGGTLQAQRDHRATTEDQS